jgi:hypothetical protein
VGTTIIFFNVEPGLCGFTDSIDAYMSQGQEPALWDMYGQNGNGQQIGTCSGVTTSGLSCAGNNVANYVAVPIAHCTEDWIC